MIILLLGGDSVPNNNIVGNKIKYYRTKKGLTQKQLAESIGKTESSIQKYERGSTEVPFSVLEKIASCLDTYLLFLLDDKYLENAAEYFKENGNIDLSNLLRYVSLLNVKLSNDINNNYSKNLDILFSKLNNLGKQEALKRIEELTEIKKYTEFSKEDD